jgi:hypothetical protein
VALLLELPRLLLLLLLMVIALHVALLLELPRLLLLLLLLLLPHPHPQLTFAGVVGVGVRSSQSGPSH